MSVGDGSLDVDSYSLRAALKPVFVDYPAGVGLFLVVVAYFFSMTTELGKNLVEFIHIYIFFMFGSVNKTNLYRSLYVGLMMIPPSDTLREDFLDPKSYVLICLSLPMALLYFFAILGFIIKKCAP
jgi:hypothetical protein